MRTSSKAVGVVALAAMSSFLMYAQTVYAVPESASASLGVFLDHRGDGAIEISPCDGKLCGNVVWIRDGAPPEACGLAIIGNVARVGKDTWDGGWILDPEFGDKFDVELTKLPSGELQVVGYWGTKALSETYVWKRAPADLQRCSAPQKIAGN